MNLKTPHDMLKERTDKFGKEAIQEAIKYVENYDGWKYGKSNKVTAAACLWAATARGKTQISREYTQEEIAEEFGVTGPAIGRRWDDMDIEYDVFTDES